jgi:hypothetical protein
LGLIAGGCSAPYLRKGDDFARSNTSQAASSFMPGTESSEEVWIVERPPNLTNTAAQSLPESSSLRAVVHGQERPMPLRHMDVNATVNGYVSTVDVRQEFENPYEQKIEAVYAFTLPQNAAVDDFVVAIGKRRIRAIIRERKLAEAIYRQAKQLGYLASLLSAEHTNTFRQTIANIEPGNSINVDIHYFQTLHFEDGWYEFLFPTLANSKGNSKEQSVPVSFSVDVNAGAPIGDLQCSPQAAVKKSITPEHWIAQLSPQAAPNEDFKLRYRPAMGQTSSGLMSYRDERGGYFTLLLHPPNDSSALTNVKIDWGAMKVSDIYPSDFTNLPAGRAVLIAGRFMGTVPPAIIVTGTQGNRPVSFTIPVDLSKTSTEKTLPKIWASMKIAALRLQTIRTGDLDVIGETRQIALDYGLASPFTTFLAVDASEPTKEGTTTTVPAVP